MPSANCTRATRPTASSCMWGLGPRVLGGEAWVDLSVQVGIGGVCLCSQVLVTQSWVAWVESQRLLLSSWACWASIVTACLH